MSSHRPESAAKSWELYPVTATQPGPCRVPVTLPSERSTVDDVVRDRFGDAAVPFLALGQGRGALNDAGLKIERAASSISRRTAVSMETAA